MDNRRADLSKYRLQEAQDSLRVAEHCLKEGLYKDSINRSYYAAFYSVKAVLALDTVDFKRHKDVMGYFNKNYVATDLFPRDLGRLLGRLKQLREKSDYDDFYLASKDQASSQYETAKLTKKELFSSLHSIFIHQRNRSKNSVGVKISGFSISTA